MSEPSTRIDRTLLDLLACPACDDRPPLRQDQDWLVCDKCTRRYPIRNGIPEVLVDSAVLPDSPTIAPQPEPSRT